MGNPSFTVAPGYLWSSLPTFPGGGFPRHLRRNTGQSVLLDPGLFWNMKSVWNRALRSFPNQAGGGRGFRFLGSKCQAIHVMFCVARNDGYEGI